MIKITRIPLVLLLLINSINCLAQIKEIFDCPFSKPKEYTEPITLVPYHKGDKWGYANRKGELVIPAVYDVAQFFNEGLALVVKGKKLGLIDTTGKVVTPFIYEYAMNFWLNNGQITLVKNNVKYRIDQNGTVVNKREALLDSIYEQFDEVDKLPNGGAIVSKITYTIQKDSLSVPVLLSHKEFHSLNDFNYYRAKSTELVGLVDSSGNFVFPVKFSSIDSDWNDNDKNVVFCLNDKYGLAKKNGTWLTDTLYDDIHWWHTGYIVESKDSIGVIDFNGNVIIPLKYSLVIPYNDLYFVGEKTDNRKKITYSLNSITHYIQEIQRLKQIGFENMTLGLLNSEGKEIIPTKYQCIDNKKFEGYYLAYDKIGTFVKNYQRDEYYSKITIYKENSNSFSPPDSSNICDIWNNYVTIKSKGLYSVYKYDGTCVLVPKDWWYMRKFKEGLAVFMSQDKKMGVVDTLGRIVVNQEYKSIGDFQNGRAAFTTYENLMGYLNSKGKIVIKPKYKSIGDFQNGYAAFTTSKNLMGYLDSTGRIVIKPIYLSVHMLISSVFENQLGGVFIVSKNDKDGNPKYGAVTKNKVIAPIVYDQFRGTGMLPNSNSFSFIKNDKYYLFYLKDGKITPKTYDSYLQYGITKDSIMMIITQVSRNGKYSFVDSLGQPYSRIEYDSVVSFKWGYKYYLNGKTGLLDNSGRELIQAKYDEIQDDYNSPASMVRNGNKYGIIIKPDGKEVIPVIFDTIIYITDEPWNMPIVVVINKDKWGIYNLRTQKSSQVKYQGDYSRLLYNNKIKVSYIPEDSSKGFKDVLIDINGEEFEYKSNREVNRKNWKINHEYINKNSSGYVLRDSLNNYILDSDGSIISGKNIYECTRGKFLVQDNTNKFGLIDSIGNTIFPMHYDTATVTRGTIALIKQNNITIYNQNEEIIKLNLEQRFDKKDIESLTSKIIGKVRSINSINNIPFDSPYEDAIDTYDFLLEVNWGHPNLYFYDFDNNGFMKVLFKNEKLGLIDDNGIKYYE